MQTLDEKAKAIRLLILDVDGVLTTGALYYGSDGFQMRGFHVHDGLGMKLLKQSGVDIAVISAKENAAVSKRLADLHIEHVYLGYEDKLPAYEKLKEKLKLQDAQIAYMGDDLPDLPLIRRVGLAFTVPNGANIIQQHAAYISKNKPGKGAVREVCEWLMNAQGTYESILQSYLTR